MAATSTDGSGSTRQRDVLRAVSDLLAGLPSAGAGAAVLDCGGGTGRLAVPLARLGADVTVVDISADALATLTRRASEAGVADRVHPVQGDVEALAEVVAVESFDLALLHGVLDAVDPRVALAAVRASLAPGAVASVLVANPVAGILAKVLAGDLEVALAELHGAPSATDRQLDTAAVTELCLEARFIVERISGIGVFADLIALGSGAGAAAAGHLSGHPGRQSRDELYAELEQRCASRPPFRDIASQLHIVARRPADNELATAANGEG